MLLLTLLMLTSPPAQAGDCEGPEDCGLAETVIPDFALVDENTRSATSGRTISRDEFCDEGNALLVQDKEGGAILFAALIIGGQAL